MTPWRWVSGRIWISVTAVFLLTAALALPTGATTPQPLTGVRSLTGGSSNVCALLISREVDCWGEGNLGQLGNGKFYSNGNQGSAAPVAVKGVGGTGTLGGVVSLASDGLGFCAVLISATWTAGGVATLASSAMGSTTARELRAPQFR